MNPAAPRTGKRQPGAVTRDDTGERATAARGAVGDDPCGGTQINRHSPHIITSPGEGEVAADRE